MERAKLNNSYSKNNKCKDCGKLITNSSIRCLSCKQKGKLNPMFNKKGSLNPRFKHGLNKCKCGKNIGFYAKKCQRCYIKTFSGITNPNFNNHKLKGKNNPMFGKIAHHGKWIKYKGIKFRSSWEVAYAKYLDKQGTEWQYEPKTFDLGNCTYTPDFYLPESDTYVEIKGWWRDDAKKKFKMFQKKYYSMNIILLTGKELKKLGIIK
jgi:hypothetical protein